ncbi:MAG: T9SS type A sorting domain-containing protein [Saprospiraceae bacterium]|nr:T9SS type A sorting domain-containing protein [Saprospiraceae bacterium]
MEYEPHRSVDIYDPNTGTWEVQYLKDVVLNNAVTSNGSLVFSAGGTKDLHEANIEMLQIVPNPATEHFRVDVPASFDLYNADITVRNSGGKTVFQKKGAGIADGIDTGSWPGGIYVVSVRLHGQLYTLRLVVL